MSSEHYALLSSNHRYGVNLNQLLTINLTERGTVDDQGSLLVDLKSFRDDIALNLAFVLFNRPEDVEETIYATLHRQDRLPDTVLGVTRLQNLHLHQGPTDELADALTDRETDINNRRRINQIITHDMTDDDLYHALIFDADQFEQPLDSDNFHQAIQMIEDYVRTSLGLDKQGMIDKYRHGVEPFSRELDEYTQKDYQMQAKRYKQIISLDIVERTRLNSLERKLYDQFEFRQQLTGNQSGTAFTLLKI